MTNGILLGAHDFILNTTQLSDNSIHISQTVLNVVDILKGSGLKELLNSSLPAAFHDSADRYPPPKCHPGTRSNFIDKVVRWDHKERILWTYGPAGVGKSAVAQTCAELLVDREELGAAFFLSRSNGWDDPNRLFPSISYQIATFSDTYAQLLDRKLQRNPTLVKKSLERQFEELFVKPFQEIYAKGEVIKDKVVIIDGLDEGAGAEKQCEIINLVVASIRGSTTPFRWAFFTRPEPGIVTSFTSSRISPLSFHLEIPVSRKTDHEILSYLTFELNDIREKHRLPPLWPSEKDVWTVVTLSAGLFIYAATVVRFVGERNALSPSDQLGSILSLATYTPPHNLDHPLSGLDLFYTLIMRSIPPKVLLIVQKILLLKSHPPFEIPIDAEAQRIANVLGLSESTFRSACASLHSVLELQSPGRIKFYHASFMDFIKNGVRSEEFCIHGVCLESTWWELLEKLNSVHARNLGDAPQINITWSHPDISAKRVYCHLVETFFSLCQARQNLDPPAAAALAKFQFQMVPRLWDFSYLHLLFTSDQLALERWRQKIPKEFRNKIVRRGYNLRLYLHKLVGAKWDRPYVLGNGKNKVLCWEDSVGYWRLVPYPPIFEPLGSNRDRVPQ